MLPRLRKQDVLTRGNNTPIGQSACRGGDISIESGSEGSKLVNGSDWLSPSKLDSGKCYPLTLRLVLR
jgi:hypothetical protein